MNDFYIDQGESKESENELKKEYEFGIQEIMHSQYKYKGDNRYLSFRECSCRFNQNKINRIIEYVHMRGEMNSYRLDISNRSENKFCSHEVSFRLHFKTTRYFDV